MRLLFASTFAHLPDARSGAAVNTDALCRGLIARGHRAAVLCRLADDGPGEPGFRADDNLGYPTFRCSVPAPALAPAVDQFQPDVIVVQTGTELMPLVLAACAHGLPVAVYLHDVETDRFGGVLVADPVLKYVANSPFTAERLRVQYGLDAVVVPPLIEPDAYRTPPGGDAALYINPIVVKGMETMFALARARPRRRFIFAESWRLNEPWRRHCRERAAQFANIEWRASVTDMRPLYAEARVVMMPSVWEETWGRAVSEGQVSGIPALASDRGNLPRTVGPGGMTVPLHAPLEDWLDAFDTFWNDDAYRPMSAAARAHAARDEISPDRVVTDLVKALSEHCRLCTRAA